MRRGVAFALFALSAGFGAFVAGPASAADWPREVSPRNLQRPDVEVFMRVDATRAEIATAERRVRATAGVARYAHLDQKDTYREFRRIFADNPELVASIRPRDLPESFRLDLERPAEAERVGRALTRLRGVTDYSTASSQKPPSQAEIQEVIRACREMDWTAEVFMQVEATPAQVEAVRIHIAGDPRVTLLQHLDHDAALAEFQQIYASDPERVSSVAAADLPESFRLRFTPGADPQSAIDELQGLPGVDEVGTPNALCRAVMNDR